jgi:hypothetical protein
MTRKSQTEPAPPAVDAGMQADKQMDAKKSATLAMRPSFGAALLTHQYTSPSVVAHAAPFLPDLAEFAAKKCSEAIEGDLSHAEAMLMSQAMSLGAIFGNLAEQAGRSETLARTEILMRIALKAQAQCTQTIRVLGELKAPKAISFIKQQNNAAGPQQVNNGTQGAPARAHESEETQATTNELLTDDREAQHAATLDTGATSRAGRENQTLETVGTVDGTGE